MAVITPLLKGLAFTLKRFFSKPITYQYPEQKREPSERWRGLHRLKTENGQLKCVACGLCEIACPAYCIDIVPGANSGKQNEVERYPVEFTIDYAVCIFCGFCEEACPEEAIFMSNDCEISMLDRKKMKYNMEQLLVPVEELKDRIEFTRKMYGKWNY